MFLLRYVYLYRFVRIPGCVLRRLRSKRDPLRKMLPFQRMYYKLSHNIGLYVRVSQEPVHLRQEPGYYGFLNRKQHRSSIRNLFYMITLAKKLFS